MIVISNSSPLIALGNIRRLDILKFVFGKIYIPKAVYQESVSAKEFPVQTQEILQALDDFIEIVEAKVDHLFKRTMDPGEKAVLNLALEMNADLIIMDENRARKEANDLKIRTIYTSTIIKIAEQRGYIASYLEIRNQLQHLNFFLPEES